MKILVLGLGNDLYGDDGIGPFAVRRLREEWLAGGSSLEPSVAVDFVECPLSGAGLLEVVRGYDALLIIDTILKSRPETGRIHLLDAADVRDVPAPSPHYISVPQTLALGRLCGLTMPETVRVVAVEAADLFEVGPGLSPAMRARLQDILAAARGALRELAAGSAAQRYLPTI
jgi:hydrogenase maturation protease